jgi:hypothetical protein
LPGAEVVDALLLELPEDVIRDALARPDAPSLDQIEPVLAAAGYA